MRMRNLLSLLLTLLIASATFGQSALLKGRVMDSSGSVMPGVQVKLMQGDTVVREGLTGNTGDFELPASPGEYKLEVTAPDFDTHNEMVRVAPDMPALAITMQLAVIAQNVDVTETRNELSVDSDSSLSTTVLGRDFIDQLPDDEDELAAYLQQIAGTRGGAGNSGSFVIDGFTGGRIPPKDQIQEIRISNSPFSSEFSGVGFGRTEIITRAGTGDFRGQMNMQFRDESLNARDPFNLTKDGSPAKRPPYQSRNFNTNFSGPIIRNKLSLNLQARHNTNQNSRILRATTVNSDGSLVQHYDPVLTPNYNRGMNARTQYAINTNNTLYTNFNYQKQENRNQGLGDFSLIERASDRFSHNTDVQIRESSILSTKVVHEVRFSYSQDSSNQAPKTFAPAIDVLQTFNAGGGQNKSSSRNKESEFGNLLLYSSSKWTLKIGSQGLSRRNRSLSENNFIGTWTFSSLTDYLSGRPRQFTKNAGDPNINVNQFEFAAFVQNDYRFSNRFSLSFGARWEDQTNISDHNNIDPRMGFAYQLGKSSVVRGGVGMFHQRFSQGNVETLLRFDGQHQLSIIVDDPLLLASFPTLPEGGTLTKPSLRTRAGDLANPYNITTSISIERSLWKNLGATFSWDSERGVHLYRGRDINAPLNGIRPNSDLKVLTQIESTGFSRSNNYTVSMRNQLNGRIQGFLFGSYTLGYNKNNTDGSFSLPVNNYDMSPEWGRSPQDTRNRFNMGGQIRLPWGISTTTQVNWSSSRPFNYTTGCDDNFDSTINDRPSAALLEAFNAARAANPTYGVICGSIYNTDGTVRTNTIGLADLKAAAANGAANTIVTRNAGNGPGQFNVQMSFQKTVRLKGGESTPANRAGNAGLTGGNNFVEPQRGGGGFPGGGDFGGQRGGDFGGQRGGNRGGNNRGNQQGNNRGNFNQNQGPTITFQAQVQNLLNHTQLNGYSGTMTSPFFGRANNARNPRQIEVGMRLNF